jgi:trimeric autotransporter adhesin
VRVDGTDQVVPVGTTVGNLLDRLGRRAPGSPPALRGVTLDRALGAAVLDPAAYDAGASQPVRLGWRGAGYAPDGDVLSLPLLPGDRLSTGESQ